MSEGSQSFILDTPAQIEAWRMLSMYRMLKLEVETGLRHSRGSVMNVVRHEFGIPYKTKKRVLAELEAILKERGILR